MSSRLNTKVGGSPVVKGPGHCFSSVPKRLARANVVKITAMNAKHNSIEPRFLPNRAILKWWSRRGFGTQMRNAGPFIPGIGTSTGISHG